MRGFGFILKAALVSSIMLGAFFALGGLDWLEGRNATALIGLDQAKEAAKTDAPPVEPAVISPQNGGAAPLPAVAAPEPSLAQSMVKPEAGSASGEEAEVAPWSLQTQDETAAPFSASSTLNLTHLAAAAPQLPPRSLRRIPPLVVKFAPAKVLFGYVNAPSGMASRSVGFYAKGCLAGGKPLPVNGPAWQAMRLSRNRIWGHPSLVRYIERFAKDAKEKDGWPGILIGDMSMPRGGPMPFGHKSHQVGLDVDIWYRPMPDRTLTDQERENDPMETYLLDAAHVNPAKWSPDYVKLLRRAVSYPEVTVAFVNPAIKKWLCDNVKEDRGFLRKIHSIGGHDDHFHVRLMCPAGNPGCRNQTFTAPSDGCGKELDAWIAMLAKQKPAPPLAAPSPKSPITAYRSARRKSYITLAQLPRDCRTVLQAASSR